MGRHFLHIVFYPPNGGKEYAASFTWEGQLPSYQDIFTSRAPDAEKRTECHVRDMERGQNVGWWVLLNGGDWIPINAVDVQNVDNRGRGGMHE